MKIAIIGNGNVGTAVYEGLNNLNYAVQIFARSPKTHSERSIEEIFLYDPQICIIAVSDNAIQNVAEYVFGLNQNTILLHMSGATPMNVLENEKHERKAVIYPLQTVRKGKVTEWKNIPVFVQGSDPEVMAIVTEIANKLSKIVYQSDDEIRLTVHLAAVITNNFINHLVVEAYHLLNKKGIDNDVLFPILKTTFEKVTSSPPELTQTGPAVRGDVSTMQRHMDIIHDPGLSMIYEVISENIIKSHGNKK